MGSWKRRIAGASAVAGVALGVVALGVSSCVRALPAPAPRVDRPVPVATEPGALSVDGVPIRIHAWPSGFVEIKRCHAASCLPESAPYLARFLSIVADRSFAAPSLPIWVYAIEHPDGLVLVDTGHDPRYYDADSWSVDPVSRQLVQSFIRIDATPEEALSARRSAAGLADRPVLAAVLTHQHVDHTGGVPDLPGGDVWTSDVEVAAADQIGALPWRWRGDATSLVTVEERGEPIDVLGANRIGASLTADDRIQVVRVGGHTPGSLAVRLRADQGTVWFVGDVAFDRTGLDVDAKLAGIHTDPATVRSLHEALRGAQSDGALLLAAHDPAVPVLLPEWGSLAAPHPPLSGDAP